MSERATATDKAALLRRLLDEHRINYLIETGLYLGQGSGMKVSAPNYVAIDCQAENVRIATANGYDVRHGDSAHLLGSVLAELDGPAVVWLDAHGIADDFTEGTEFCPFPLEAELKAIATAEYDHVVAIDDMDMMGEESWQPLTGSRSAADIENYVDGLGCWRRRREHGTILVLEPR